MHMPERNAEFYKLIDEPLHLEHSFVLGYGHEVVVLGIGSSKLGHKVIVD